MDSLEKLSRVIEAIGSLTGTERTSAIKKVVKLFVIKTSWPTVSKDLLAISKSDITAEKFGITDEEFSDAKRISQKSKNDELVHSVYQKAVGKKLEQFLSELQKDANESSFEEVILPLLVLSVDLPLKYLPEGDPFGKHVNYSANDRFSDEKTFLYAPKSYKSLSLSPSSTNSLTRRFLLPILQHVIKSEEYITSDRLKDVPFIVQCLRFAVHYEDPSLEILRSSFWELAIKVMKAVDLEKTDESRAIFDQLNALTWHDNGEDCTKAVWGSIGASPSKSLVMSKEEVYAYIALLRSITRRVTFNVHLRSCLRDSIKSIMKSISYRKSSEDLEVLLKLVGSWIRKGKESPVDLNLARTIVKDIMEAYDSFLAKSPSLVTAENTKSLLLIGQDCLAINSHFKSVRSSLENLFDRVNSNISKSNKDAKESMTAYVKFLLDILKGFGEKALPELDENAPWYFLFRSFFIRCFVSKLRFDWLDNTDLLRPLFMKMSELLNTVKKNLENDRTCDYLNECIPTLTETIYIIINGELKNEKKWECTVLLNEWNIPTTVIQSISLMKNKSARVQCSAFISKMVEPLSSVILTLPPKSTLPHFESLFTESLTIDLPDEIRDSVCKLWKHWYGSRIEELDGIAMKEPLIDRLKWFNLPLPKNTINADLEVKIEIPKGSPRKSVSTSSSRTRNALFTSPAPIKKTKSANEALKIIDLMDEDSVQFFPVVESPKKKQRMTEKQKEMMMEKKDKLPFMEDESRSGMPKLPADIFEMSISGVDGSSKSGGSKKTEMTVDFSEMIEKKEKREVKEDNEEKGEKEDKEEKKKKKKKVDDSNVEESASSCESVVEEEEKGRGGRRKSKTPMKMMMKTREVKSPSRKKIEADSVIAVDSPRRKSKRMAKIEEIEKNEEKEEEKKKEKEKEEDEKEKEKKEGESDTIEEKKVSTPKRSDKIVVSPSADIEMESRDDDAPLPPLDEIPSSSSQSSISSNEDLSPLKVPSSDDLPVPSTPASRGAFEPVGILSSKKKMRSEKKRGGVHFNLAEEVKIVEEEEKKEGKKEDEIMEKEKNSDKEEEADGIKMDKSEEMVFPLLRNCEDSIDSITLKLGSNSRLVKISFDKIGVKRVGDLAALNAKEINAIMGIKPPKMRTVEAVLEGVYARAQKSASKPLPSICTPEKKNESTVEKRKSISPQSTIPLPSIELSPLSSKQSPPKSKSRKRLALSDSPPIRVKKMKDEEKKSVDEEKKEEEGNNKQEEKKEEDPKDMEKESKEDDIETIEEEKKKREESVEIEVIGEMKEIECIGEKKTMEVIRDKTERSAKKKRDKKEKKEEEDIEMIDEEKENEERNEIGMEEGEKKKNITSVEDVMSLIGRLKDGSMEGLVTAYDDISRAFLDAIKEKTSNSSM